jgi:Dynamin central region/Dynamin family
MILQYRETHVAPDVICLTIWSPDCQEELTLVDLPGIVQFQHQHDVSLLSQVEHVVLEYVQNPRSILVPVVAAPSNIHNSKVLQWAKDVDPTTARTIPVLTKPDLMDPGSESDVLELLESPLLSGFQHGFHLVMNRGQAQLDAGLSLPMALKVEAEYFASAIPWNAMSEHRLGIPALRRRLATTLSRVMQETIPDILRELRTKQEGTRSELEAMGAMFQSRSDQRKFFHTLSRDLVANVSASLSGKGKQRRQTYNTNQAEIDTSRQDKQSSPVGGASKLHAACHEFFQQIQSSSLATVNRLVEGANVLVSCPGSQQTIRGEIVYITPVGSHACVDFVDVEDHTTEVLFDAINFVSEQPDFEEDEVWSEDGHRVFIGRSGGRFDSLRKIPCNRIRTDPSWLQAKMDQYRTDDLACFINVDMFQHLVAEFVHNDWVPPCHKLVDSLQNILRESLDQALQDQLGVANRFPLLVKMIKATCHRVADEGIARARSQVHEHLEMEEQHPYTQDEVLLQAMNRSRFSTLRTELELQLRLDQEGVVYDTQAIKSILDRVFAKHQSSNWLVEQMELVLSCYGQVATQRVLDRTPQICWQACRSLSKSLQEELGCMTDDVLETCLWESPATKKKFQDLQHRLDDLESTLDALRAM